MAVPKVGWGPGSGLEVDRWSLKTPTPLILCSHILALRITAQSCIHLPCITTYRILEVFWRAPPHLASGASPTVRTAQTWRGLHPILGLPISGQA